MRALGGSLGEGTKALGTFLESRRSVLFEPPATERNWLYVEATSCKSVCQREPPSTPHPHSPLLTLGPDSPSSHFQLKLPQIQKIMMEFERQAEIMDMKEEMMNDAIDDAMGDEDDEEERFGDGWQEGGEGCLALPDSHEHSLLI